MLYELTAVIGDPNDPEGHVWRTRVVEAPAHRKGVLPAGLWHWFDKTYLTQWGPEFPVLAWSIAEFHPVRLGYRDANEYGVSGGGCTSTLHTGGDLRLVR